LSCNTVWTDNTLPGNVWTLESLGGGSWVDNTQPVYTWSILDCCGNVIATVPPTPVVVVPPTTWNPGDERGSIALSIGNLQAVNTGSSLTYNAVRATAGRTSGLLYAEFAMIAGGGTFGSSYATLVGIATGSASLTTWNNNNAQGGIAINPYQGHIYYNGADSLLGGSPLNNGDVVGMAVDFVNLRCWFRVNNGNWNWNAANSPITNVGGVDISSVFGGGVAAYPTAGFYINGDGVTANFGASSFTYAPTGISAWG
jgi:hypothetical protein